MSKEDALVTSVLTFIVVAIEVVIISFIMGGTDLKKKKKLKVILATSLEMKNRKKKT